MNRTTRLMVGLCSLLLLGALGTGCKKKQEGPSNVEEQAAQTAVQATASVRVVHGANAGAIDVSVNGVSAASGLNKNAFTRQRVSFPAGSDAISVSAGGQNIVSTNANISANQSYTLVVLGNAQNGYSVALIKDNLSNASGKNRFVNGLTGAGAVNFASNGGQTVASGVTYGHASSFASLPAGFQRVVVKSGATTLGTKAVPKAPASRAVTTVVVPEGSGIHVINVVDRP